MASILKPRILLGVNGSIAAYKAVELIFLLKKFSDVRVVATEAASHLVDLRELRKASGAPVWTSLFKGSTPIPSGTPSGTHPLAVVPHIEYAKSADLILIAPATADFMAKMALGLADDLLSSLCLYATCPLWVAPAMNVNMWKHPATARNRKLLFERGVRFIGPDQGHLACGDVGEGRFVEPTEIAFQAESYFNRFGNWRGKKILVTAGPTQEAIDPVRIITNRSSGKMGYALAQAALNRGAEVTLIHGPVSLSPLTGAKMVPVMTALELNDKVLGLLPQTHVLIMAAAVADYSVAKPSKNKIKKNKNEILLNLRKNPDILGEVLNKRKKTQIVVGFAAETEKLKKNAKEKWEKKRCDLLVANLVGRKGTGFDSDQNELVVFSKKMVNPIHMRKDLKSRLAEKILDLVDAFFPRIITEK